MVYYKEVKRPAVVEQYFDGANAIDIHNHLRQGGLELERHWQTQTWWHRNFATIIGICETDAFLTFQRFHPNKTLTTNLSHRGFTERLSLQLLTFKASINLAWPAKRLRARISTETPVQPLQTHAAYVLNSHTLKGNMRDSPVFQPKCQRLSQDSASGNEDDSGPPYAVNPKIVCCVPREKNGILL